MNSFDEKKITSPWPVVAVLFILFPPLGILGAIALLGYTAAKQSAGKRNTAPSLSSMGERLRRRLLAEEAAERPGQRHSHTPVAYSYDACAREKRLEQLRVLKDAGLLDTVEYQQRRQEILKQL